jgi:phosphomannomutase
VECSSTRGICRRSIAPPKKRRINVLDGVRVYFRNGDIAHIRPSGNAPQLRIYANSDSQTRADEIVELALREPEGILRQLERALT